MQFSWEKVKFRSSVFSISKFKISNKNKIFVILHWKCIYKKIPSGIIAEISELFGFRFLSQANSQRANEKTEIENVMIFEKKSEKNEDEKFWNIRRFFKFSRNVWFLVPCYDTLRSMLMFLCFGCSDFCVDHQIDPLQWFFSCDEEWMFEKTWISRNDLFSNFKDILNIFYTGNLLFWHIFFVLYIFYFMNIMKIRKII